MFTWYWIVSDWLWDSFIDAKVDQMKGLFLRKLVTDCYIIEKSHVVENIVYLFLPHFLPLFLLQILSSHLTLFPFIQRVLKILVVIIDKFVENKRSLIRIRKQRLDFWDFSFDKRRNFIFVKFLLIQLIHKLINNLDENEKIIFIKQKLNWLLVFSRNQILIFDVTNLSHDDRFQICKCLLDCRFNFKDFILVLVRNVKFLLFDELLKLIHGFVYMRYWNNVLLIFFYDIFHFTDFGNKPLLLIQIFIFFLFF